MYCLSTENLVSRPPGEVDVILSLIERKLLDQLDFAIARGIRLVVIGRVSALPHKLQNVIEKVEQRTATNTNMTVCLALNYGGRDEIVTAARALVERAARGEMGAGDVTDEVFERCLNSAQKGIGPPDLVIRTSGERRLSNFMLVSGAAVKTSSYLNRDRVTTLYLQWAPALTYARRIKFLFSSTVAIHRSLVLPWAVPGGLRGGALHRHALAGLLARPPARRPPRLQGAEEKIRGRGGGARDPRSSSCNAEWGAEGGGEPGSSMSATFQPCLAVRPNS
jgi:hypothetical protein